MSSTKGATFKNIVAELGRLEKECRKGDIVYLHFSTHGQLVEDLNGDEPDRWDESIVPVDALLTGSKGKYEGENHLTDDKLSLLVSSIRKQVGPKGMVYVVLDACFSGDSSRGEDEYIRGTQKAFTRTGYVKINTKNRRNRNVKAFVKLDKSANYSHVTYIEACQADEVNTEIKDASTGKLYGPLSYHIASFLKEHELDTSDKWVKSVQQQMRKDGRVRYQNMLVESTKNQ